LCHPVRYIEPTGGGHGCSGDDHGAARLLRHSRDFDCCRHFGDRHQRTSDLVEELIGIFFHVEQFQEHAQEQTEAATASANRFAANVKTITTAHAEYTKKGFQDGLELISKLTTLKSPDEAMKLQADYAKSAYETFVAESKTISDLYIDFAKQTFKPFEGLIAKMSPAK
jgi:hypothetical protein